MKRIPGTRPQTLHTIGLFWLLVALALPHPLLAQSFDPPTHPVLPQPLQVGEDERIRVIVELDTSFRPEGTLRSATAAQYQRSTIAQQQNMVMDELAVHDADVIAAWETIPFMAVTVDADGLEALRKSSQVLSIREDRLDYPLLNGSTVHIGAPLAWEAGYEGSDQMVVVLDSGVDKSHPFFGDRVVEEACFSGFHAAYPEAPPVESGIVSMCPSGQTRQTGPGSAHGLAPECTVGLNGGNRCWHGTAVAGIAAGANPGDQHFSGVAKGSNIAAIQVFTHFTTTSACGSSSDCIASYTSDQINALEYVLTELHPNYDIAAVNMSLGGSHYSDQTLCDTYNQSRKAIIDNLRAVGIPTIIAAGNSGRRDAITAPACISSAIAVSASVDPTDVIWPSASIHDMVELMAPGSKISAPLPSSNPIGYLSTSGSSFAAPHVTGVWAILKELDPEASIDELLLRLQNTGVPITDTRSSGTVTKPRINLCGALMEMGVAAGIELKAKVLLQGAFRNVEAGIGFIEGSVMHDTLRSLEESDGFQGTYLPNSEPYSAQYGIGRGETIADPASVLADHGDDAIVDWVYLDLRDATSPATILATRAALLQRDGDVVDVDGTSPVAFDCTMPDRDYYVAVRHRNHLGAMTANAVRLTATGSTVDFTDTTADFWHNDAAYDGQEQATLNGRFVLWSGNASSSSALDNAQAVEDAVLGSATNVFDSLAYRYPGYHAADVDMDGKVVASGAGNEQALILRNVQNHPLNAGEAQDFVVIEQLAAP